MVFGGKGTGKDSFGNEETMRIAVCDDEKEIREMLAGQVQKLYPKAELFLYQSGEELLLSCGQADIVLLDIQMSGKNGMAAAREFRKKQKEAILIFVTALEEYVFQAFDVGAFHYLVKPVDDKKLAEVLQRAAEQMEEKRKEAAADAKKEVPNLIVTAGGKHIAVKFSDIVYAEVFNRKVMLHTMDAEIEYYGKLGELEKQAGEDFYRPHRAYLVNFAYVRKYDASAIYLARGQALMAKQKYQDFVKCYLRYNRRKGRE